MFKKDYRLYGESFWSVLEELHKNEDELTETDFIHILLNKPMLFDDLRSMYDEASATSDRDFAIDFEEVDSVWPDQMTIQYREESGPPKLRLKIREYKIIYAAQNNHAEHPRVMVSASIKKGHIRWLMLVDTESLMRHLARPAVGELRGDEPSRQRLREQGVFQRRRGHGGSWAYHESSKQLEFHVEAIDKAGVRYFMLPDDAWTTDINQHKLPF